MAKEKRRGVSVSRKELTRRRREETYSFIVITKHH